MRKTCLLDFLSTLGGGVGGSQVTALMTQLWGPRPPAGIYLGYTYFGIIPSKFADVSPTANYPSRVQKPASKDGSTALLRLLAYSWLSVQEFKTLLRGFIKV